MNRPESGSNFGPAFLFLSARRREALRAVYAFCRHADDLVDSGELPPERVRGELEALRGEVERLYSGEPSRELMTRLVPFVREFDLPKEGFLELLRGVEMDLDRDRYETSAELERYMFGVAGAVGLLCVEIFGHRATPAERLREYAVSMGNALQLTNIIRDVGADLEKGRVYLPLEDLRAAGCPLESFLRREHTPGFASLMALEYSRAKEYYRRARAALDPADRRAMLPAEVMARVYEALLEEIRDGGFRVFFRRAALPPWRKAVLALGAAAGAYRIGVEER